MWWIKASQAAKTTAEYSSESLELRRKNKERKEKKKRKESNEINRRQGGSSGASGGGKKKRDVTKKVEKVKKREKEAELLVLKSLSSWLLQSQKHSQSVSQSAAQLD